MYEILVDNINAFREVLAPQNNFARMPAKRVIVWVDVWGHGIRPPKLYIIHSDEERALSELQDLWNKCYQQGAIKDLKFYDADSVDSIITYVGKATT
jgi:hypothetical protein